MGIQIAVRLADEQIAWLDAAVAAGTFESRADAVRAGIDRIVREARESEIADRYRRGYGQQPQEEWVGEAGLVVGAELVKQEQSRTRPRRKQ